MRLSIKHLLLYTAIFAISLVVSLPLTGDAIRATWRHNQAESSIRHMRIWADTERVVNPNIKFQEYDTNRLLVELGSLKDPWGNKYNFVKRERSGIFDCDSDFHVYSTGIDGQSYTDGNDDDDINSWNYNKDTYYTPKVVAPFAKQMSTPKPTDAIIISCVVAMISTLTLSRILWPSCEGAG